MKRRDFILALGGAAAWPLAAHAQQQAMPVIGFLRSTAAAGSTHLVTGFRRGLNEVGFIDGENVAVEYRFADDDRSRVRDLANELISRQVAVIVGNTIVAQAAKDITATVPIVFVAGSDPITTGLVGSLNRPGGNLTGVVFTTVDLTGKRLGLLHELIPTSTAIAVLLDPNVPAHEIELRGAEEARRALGRQIQILKAASEREVDTAFEAIVQTGAGALLVGSGPFFLSQRRRLVELAARHALPASYVTRQYPDAGGLMSYGPNQTDAYRQAGVYAGRIVRGAKPADLPVIQPTRFELVINLKTAKAIGVDVPWFLQQRADEVIE